MCKLRAIVVHFPRNKLTLLFRCVARLLQCAAKLHSIDMTLWDYFKTINRISFLRRRAHSPHSHSSCHQRQSNDNHPKVERLRSFITGRASNYYYYYFINNETRQKQRSQLLMLSAAIHVWHIDLPYRLPYVECTALRVSGFVVQRVFLLSVAFN